MYQVIRNLGIVATFCQFSTTSKKITICSADREKLHILEVERKGPEGVRIKNLVDLSKLELKETEYPASLNTCQSNFILYLIFVTGRVCLCDVESGKNEYFLKTLKL